MRPVNYFKNRIEFALKGNGTIKVNQNDLEALNQIIEFYNTNYKNTQLEDSLLLLYILQNWKVENKENLELSEISQGIFKITDTKILLQKIGMQLTPKLNVIKEITNELRLHQKMNKVPEENLITFEDVAQLLEQELQIAKNNFAFIKQLNGNSIVKLAYKKGLSEPQKEILGIK